MRKRVYKEIMRNGTMHTDKHYGGGNDRRADKIKSGAPIGKMAKHFRAYRDRLAPK